MSVDGWNTLLVLGGIRSGKSEFAESLVADAPTVRYVATAAAGDPADAEWAARLEAHRRRRPGGWSTEETADDPRRLADVIASAGRNDTLLVDDLGGWVTVLLDPAHQPADDTATIAELAAAVRACPARLVLVSPEVGLSLVPTTPLGRAFTDALGAANRAVADACDAVVLVVAGQPCWLKPTAAPAVAAPDGRRPAPAAPTPAAGALAAAGAVAAVTAVGGEAGAAGIGVPAIGPGMELPMPDEDASSRAVERLATLDVPGAGLGVLDRVVGFAAATQGTPTPASWDTVRVLLLHGDHAGGAAAGSVPGESARRAAQARAGQGMLARLAAESGVELQVADAPASGPMEEGPALTAEAVEDALRHGWRLAGEAADAGVRLLVLASCSAGSDAAAAAVLAATAGAEPPAVLGRVVTAAGRIDDAAWMRRCAAVRDALHRTRHAARDAKGVLAELGGGDIAVATGVLLGATARQVPVLLDGPVGVAAGMVSRDLAGQARHWCLLADHGGHPAVRLAADVLGLAPLLDLRLDLGEGANALAALPLLRSVLSLAAALPPRPAPDDDPAATDRGGDEPAAEPQPAENSQPAAEPQPAGDPQPGDDSEFAEPEPTGPGPATTGPTTAEPTTTRPAPTAPEQPAAPDQTAAPDPAGRRAG
jgi:nicotinate-nucleotide--dimethylbenzimidazole phosphoribosyltransferase